MQQKILIADDEPRMRKLIRDYCTKEGYAVLEAGTGEEAVDTFLSAGDVSLVVLDVMMPGMDGWEALREIRGRSEVPVIMLTARSEEQDELKGFGLGADEYVTKPFSPRTLMARIAALLRRTGAGEDQVLEAGGITLNRSAHEVTVDGEPVPLSVREFDLLEYFMEHRGVALSRETILDQVWNYDYYGDARTIDTHVKKLRAKLGEKGELIRTIWGMGYKFEG